MKSSLFAVLMLAASPVLRADAPILVTELAPVAEINGTVELLMADGSALRARKLLGLSPDVLRIMTDDGIAKIPLNTLHPKTLAKLNSLAETPEQQQARQQKAAAAAQSYRDNQALKERMAAEENATVVASQRAEAARQEAARQAAADAYARQQQYFMEAKQAQDAQSAKRNAELAAAERVRMQEEQRQQQQYNMAVAAEAASAAANAEQFRQAHPGVLAAMMTPDVRAASGVDKLDINDQTLLKLFLTDKNIQAPVSNTWGLKLLPAEKDVLTAWMNQKRQALFPAKVADGAGQKMPIHTYLTGNFTGLAPGKVYRLGNDQLWEQIDSTTKAVQQYHNDTSVTISHERGAYYMTVSGFGAVMVKRVVR